MNLFLPGWLLVVDVRFSKRRENLNSKATENAFNGLLNCRASVMEEKTGKYFESAPKPSVDELLGTVALENELHQRRLARPWLSVNPKQTGSSLEPVHEDGEVKDPSKGIFERTVYAYDSEIELSGVNLILKSYMYALVRVSSADRAREGSEVRYLTYRQGPQGPRPV